MVRCSPVAGYGVKISQPVARCRCRDVDASEFVERVPFDSVPCGLNYKLVYPNVRINVKHHFFAVRNILVWNSISSNVVEVESISCFKARLSKENLTKCLKI